MLPSNRVWIFLIAAALCFFLNFAFGMVLHDGAANARPAILLASVLLATIAGLLAASTAGVLAAVLATVGVSAVLAGLHAVEPSSWLAALVALFMLLGLAVSGLLSARLTTFIVLVGALAGAGAMAITPSLPKVAIALSLLACGALSLLAAKVGPRVEALTARGFKVMRPNLVPALVFMGLYCALNFLFALAYVLILYLVPGGFEPSAPETSRRPISFLALLQWSLVAAYSAGTFEWTPLHPIARLTYILQIVGNVFLLSLYLGHFLPKVGADSQREGSS